MKTLFIFIGLSSMAFGQQGQFTCSNSGGCYIRSNTATTTAAITATTLTSGGVLTLGWGDGSVRETRPKTNAVSLKLVKASASLIPKAHLAPAAYVTLAKSIGLESAATDEARLIQAIAECDLPVYDYDKVDNYLYHQTLSSKIPMRWGWKPLREADVKAVLGYSNGALSSAQDGFGLLFSRQYAGKVPEQVLTTVAMILKKVPDATFMVSDYEAIKPDPFLMVTTPRMMEAHRMFIVSQWDEAGFGEDVPMPSQKLGFSSMQ